MMTSESRQAAPPEFGEPAPFLKAATDGVETYALDVAAGRWIVLMAFGSLSVDACRTAHAQILRLSEVFDDEDAAFFGVSVDPADRLERGLRNAPRGLRYFWDFDRSVCKALGLVNGERLQPAIFLIDRSFRIACAAAIEETAEVLNELARQLAAERHKGVGPPPPVLWLPRIFEPEFCAELMSMFLSGVPSQSGFAAVVGERTVTVLDPRLKRRRDVTVEEEGVRARLEAKLRARLFPIVRKAFGWTPEFIERYLLSCYGADDQGFFSAHRDDVTPGTAHRKFAVSVFLNDDYDGGALRFPEFGGPEAAPVAGGAAVFACGLLHEVTPVTRGERYAFVPFLYDAAGESLRRANLSMVG